MSLNFFRISLICLGILALTVQAILYFQGFLAISADESGRTLVAYDWLHHGLSTPPIWLPLFTGVTAGALHVFPDLFWTPRIVATLSAMFCFISVLWLSRELFEKRGIVLLTAALTLAFGPRVILSAAPLSETMFAGLVISGCALFARSQRNESTGAVLASAFFFALSTAVRYEGWIYSVAFIVAVYCSARVNRTRAREMFLVSATSAITLAFPIIWMALHWYSSGSPTAFISGTANRYELLHGSDLATLLRNSLPFQFAAQSFSTMNFFGIFFVGFLIFHDRKVRIWSIIPIVSLLAMSILSISGKGMPSHNFWRIPFSWSMLLLPFTAYFLFSVWRFLESRSRLSGWIFLFGFLVVYNYLAANSIYGWVPNSGFTKGDLAAGRYIQRRLEDGDSPLIILDSGSWSYLNVVVASQHPDSIVADAGRDPVVPEESLLSRVETMQGREILVILESPNKKEAAAEYSGFQSVAKFGKWTIFSNSN